MVEHKYVQQTGTQNEDFVAWQMRVKAYMVKQKLWYVFKQNNDGSEQFMDDEESARNELISWLGNKFLRLAANNAINAVMSLIEEEHENLHRRPTLTELKTSLYSKRASLANLAKFIEEMELVFDCKMQNRSFKTR